MRLSMLQGISYQKYRHQKFGRYIWSYGVTISDFEKADYRPTPKKRGPGLDFRLPS